MLQGTWKHYHYSPKAVRELKELAETMQVRAYKAVKADFFLFNITLHIIVVNGLHM